MECDSDAGMPKAKNHRQHDGITFANTIKRFPGSVCYIMTGGDDYVVTLMNSQVPFPVVGSSPDTVIRATGLRHTRQNQDECQNQRAHNNYIQLSIEGYLPVWFPN